MDGLDAGKMLSFIEESGGLDRKFIGKMDLKGAYSFFEVDKEKAESFLNEFKGIEYKGRQVRIEITERSNSGSRRESSSGRDFKKPGARSSGGSFKGGRSSDRGGKSSDYKRKRY
jgi:ATP-dependent RNA helicase DeaD